MRILIPLMLAMLLLGSCGGSKQPELSKEEIRVLHASQTDTTALRAKINPAAIEGYEQLHDLSAEAWMLVDSATGIVISQKNADSCMQVASLTKIMTGLLALEYGHEQDTVEITRDVFVARNSRVRLNDGYLAGDLLYEMMLESDNDAAYALAKHVAGDTLSFYALMNAKAIYLHMNSTHFASPNGMPNADNYSTARDFITLARYCMADSAFAAIVGTKQKDVPLTNGKHLVCQNTNRLLYVYDGCIGIKTGYTRQAGNCLASAATRGDVTLYLILLKSRSRSSRFTESATLLDYGFRAMEAYRQAAQGD